MGKKKPPKEASPRSVLTDRSAIDLANQLHNFPSLGFDTESSGPLLVDTKAGKDMVNMCRADLTGMSFHSPDGKSYYCPVGHHTGATKKTLGNVSVQAFATLMRSFSEYKGVVAIHNAKHEKRAITQGPVPASLPPRVACTQVAMWLAGMPSEPEWLTDEDGRRRPRPKGKEVKSPYGLKALVKAYRGVERADFKTVTQGRSFCALTPEEGLDYACEDAEDALFLWGLAEPRLKELGLESVFWDLEMPFVDVLRHMEDSGMAVDADRLMEVDGHHAERMEELEEDWEWLMGMPGAAMRSAPQLQQLFETGVWPTGVTKKMKEGWSTDKDNLPLLLDHLEPDSLGYQAVKIKQEYAVYANLRSKFSHKFVAAAWQHPDQRLHASIFHTGTATGRLAVANPPLQQIPKRTPIGKRIREGLVAADGCSFLSADYSQIELRVLAHIIGKGALYEAYKHGTDAHKALADELSALLNRPVSRDDGKISNFSTIYSVGPEKFGKKLGMSTADAKVFLALFKKLRPEMFAALDGLVDDCEEAGYARTLVRRRRVLPVQEARQACEALRDAGKRWPDPAFKKEWLQCGGWERIARNTPIQGSAADLMKMAMVDFYRTADLKRCRMTMQIHDDLLTECDDDYLLEAAEILQHCMESQGTKMGLRVPLVAEPSHGKRMSDL